MIGQADDSLGGDHVEAFLVKKGRVDDEDVEIALRWMRCSARHWRRAGESEQCDRDDAHRIHSVSCNGDAHRRIDNE